MSLLSCVCSLAHKHSTAVCWDDLEHPYVWTYAELLTRAREITCNLRGSGLIQQAVVGLYGESCPEMLAAMLGILALPAAYLPVDLSQTDFMEVLREHGVDMLLVHLPLFQSFLSRLPKSCAIVLDTSLLEHGVVLAELNHKDKVTAKNGNFHSTAVCGNFERKPCSSQCLCTCCVDTLARQQTNVPPDTLELYHKETGEYLSASPHPDCNIHCTMTTSENQAYSLPLEDNVQSLSNSRDWLFPAASPSSLAYVLTTSGTTGRPKPVKVPHCCIVPNVLDLRERFSVNSDDVIFNAAPLTFDPSVVEIFLALSTGATLLIVPSRIKRSPFSLASVLLHRRYASVLQVTPALVYQLAAAAAASEGSLLGAWSSVRVLAFGGEECPSLALLQKWKHRDNETRVFNLYGITEVSSWASCQHIALSTGGCSEPATATAAATAAETRPAGRQVPLGEPLLGTAIELRTEDGSKITHGFGEIWIGGEYRVCLLGNEQQLVWGCMRPSGDFGYLDDSGLFFEGRCDDQVKRAGHRINLSSIQQEVLAFEHVSACALATVAEDSFSSSALSHQLGPAHSLPGVTDLLLAFVVPHTPVGMATFDLQQTLLSLQTDFKAALPSHCVPDKTVFVKRLPTTEHGKVDTKSLVDCAFPDLYLPVHHATTDETVSLQSSQSISLDASVISSTLEEMATQLLGIEGWTGCLLDHGASSFDVVFLANRFEQDLENKLKLRLNFSLLVDHLLSRPLNEVVRYVCGGPDANAEGTSIKRSQERDFEELPASKKLLTTSLRNGRTHSWRRGQHFINGELQPNTTTTAAQPPPSSSTTVTPATLHCSLRVKWKVDTGRCVDASPLLVAGEEEEEGGEEEGGEEEEGGGEEGGEEGGQPAVVYVGSHSGLLFAIAARSGEVLWSRQLSDRIESSACLSVCGLYVVVGCYDGRVYTVARSSGEVHWCLHSGSEPVKSSPCADPITRLIWFGSHDHKLYAIDIAMRCVVHCIAMGGGACFSSPCLDTAARRLYCATLQGVLSAVDADSGCVVWSCRCPSPLFSSPTLLPGDSVAVGCVDGLVYVIGSQGTRTTELSTEKPVFSSCCVVMGPNAAGNPTFTTENDRDGSSKTRTNIYCGSHDKCIHCWNGNWGLEWKTQLASEIYSIPCCCSLKLNAYATPAKQAVEVFALCVCVTSGQVCILSANGGDIIGQFQLPGHVFSSPVSTGNAVIVGCRDDNVYCLEVSVELL